MLICYDLKAEATPVITSALVTSVNSLGRALMLCEISDNIHTRGDWLTDSETDFQQLFG